MKLGADTLRLILGLTHFEVWPPWRIARVLGLATRDVVEILDALREFQLISRPIPSGPKPQPHGALEKGLAHDLF